VFVVDADEVARGALMRLLSSEGYDVRPFDGLERFLAAATGASTGCLVLDLGTASAGGADLRRRLDAHAVRLPIVAVSASEGASVRAEARRLGAKAFFRKPVDERTLIDAIDWALSSSGSPAAD
jgi:FixJ family two-component response regulator